MKKKIRKRVAPGIYKFGFQDPHTGRVNYPPKLYETYRLLQGSKEREYQTFTSFMEAKEFHNSLGKKIEARASITFAECWDKFYLSAGSRLSLNTLHRLENERRHLVFFDKIPIEQIVPETIDRWLAFVKAPQYLEESGGKRYSYKMELRCLRQVLNFYREINHAYPPPILRRHWESIKVREPRIKQEKDLSLEELQRFAHCLDQITKGTEYEFISYLAKVQYFIYGRIQEAAALFVEDVNFEKGIVRVQRRVEYLRRGAVRERLIEGLKFGRYKDIPSEECVKLIREWMFKSGIRTGLLFPLDGKTVPYRAIQYRYDKAFKMAGVDRSGTHVLRHGSLTEHYSTSGDLKLTSKVAGHANVATTEIYAKVRSDSVKVSQKIMDEKIRLALSPSS